MQKLYFVSYKLCAKYNTKMLCKVIYYKYFSHAPIIWLSKKAIYEWDFKGPESKQFRHFHTYSCNLFLQLALGLHRENKGSQHLFCHAYKWVLQTPSL